MYSLFYLNQICNLYIHTLHAMNLKNVKSKCNEHFTGICYMSLKFIEYSYFKNASSITIKTFNFKKIF